MVIPYYVNLVVVPIALSFVRDKILHKNEKIFSIMQVDEFWIIIWGLSCFEGGMDLIYVFLGGIRSLRAEEWLYTPIIIFFDVTILVGNQKFKILSHKKKDHAIIEPGEDVIWGKTRKCFFIFFSLVGIFCYCFLRWYELNFNVTFDALLFTLLMPVEGTDSGIIYKAIAMIVPFFAFLSVAWYNSVYQLVRNAKRGGKRNIRLGRMAVIGASAVCMVALVKKIGVLQYVFATREYSQIYENNYVLPTLERVRANEKKRNLILVYLESMENTYCDNENGGNNKKNYIPHLTQMAKENVSFSSGNKMGGGVSCYGMGWTMAATIATTSGVPFAFPIENDALEFNEKIASSLVTMGDLLTEEGYNMEVILGSDSDFAGKKKYFRQHGGYKVFDYDKIVEEGYVPDGFHEWWGVRDEIVYQVVKDEITKLSEEEEPFVATFYTADTHNPGGYKCPLCMDEEDEPLGDVLFCADRQIDEFVSWCKEQPFYENTTIVLIGDHPRLDNYLIGDWDLEQRTTYNCIINGVQKENVNTKNRCFTTLDYFPTILSSMGYQIKGDRLGLGTDLFSDTPTLSEEFGLSWLNEELAKKSKYYIENFY